MLDSSPVVLPAGIEATIAPLERVGLGAAELACADLLIVTWPEAAAAAATASAAPPLAAYVRAQLVALEGSSAGR